MKALMNYMDSQLLQVAPLPVLSGNNGQFKIKVISDKGQTNWLNVTSEQFKKIENILCE